MDGLLFFNKPILWTSHDAVDFIRRVSGEKRVGHAGTLDPMATGLLIMLVGKSTKRQDEFLGMDKSYEGTIQFGTETDSYDLDGKILARRDASHLTDKEISDAFASFTGDILQAAPAFSALKKDGKKLYELARKGEEVEAKIRPVRVEEFHLNYFEENEAAFTLSCSKGTYVRSLARDAGQKLGTGACLSSLVRTRIGPFGLERAATREELLIKGRLQASLYEDLSRV